jgi:hypothetical protein
VRSDRTLLRLYRLVNKKFFDNTLPHDTCVRYLKRARTREVRREYFGWTSNIKDTDQDDGRHTYCIVISESKEPRMDGNCSNPGARDGARSDRDARRPRTSVRSVETDDSRQRNF